MVPAASASSINILVVTTVVGTATLTASGTRCPASTVARPGCPPPGLADGPPLQRACRWAGWGGGGPGWAARCLPQRRRGERTRMSRASAQVTGDWAERNPAGVHVPLGEAEEGSRA